ncbi:MAG: isoprenoid biosynthesis glyoxalase ElbB, partial [Pseudomonadota bacterium]
MKNIALVLSGCGFKDGAEITEVVSSLVILSELGAKMTAFAPDLNFQTTNHLNDHKGEERNVLTEAARITRGKIQPLSELKERDFDGVVFPGGFGAALHLCDWANKGADATVETETRRVIESFHSASKPIAALCISPALISLVLGKHSTTVTIGNDKATGKEIEKTGAIHEDCVVDDFITDRLNKVVTTPAYMFGEA